MRKAWKKAVSVLLTLVLIFGVLPGINVSAEDEGASILPMEVCRIFLSGNTALASAMRK